MAGLGKSTLLNDGATPSPPSCSSNTMLARHLCLADLSRHRRRSLAGLQIQTISPSARTRTQIAARR